MSGNSYQPPNIWTPGLQYNSAYFTSSSSSISLQYANNNYLQRVGNSTDIATSTTFNGTIYSSNIIPSATGSSLGTALVPYSSGYISNLQTTNVVATGPTGITSTNLYLAATGSIYQGSNNLLSNADFLGNNSNVWLNSYVPGGLTNTANYNVSINNALNSLTSGSFNQGVGNGSGLNLTSGSYNTFVGSSAGNLCATGSNNLCFGYQSGNLLNGSNNITLNHPGAGGTSSATWLTSKTTNRVYICSDSSQSATINLGTASQTMIVNVGSQTASSSVNLNAGSGKVNINGQTVLTSSVDSGSPITGSLVLAGGLGITKNIFSAGTITSVPNISTSSIDLIGGLYYTYTTTGSFIPVYVPNGTNSNSASYFGVIITPSIVSAYIRIKLSCTTGVSSGNIFQYGLYRSINGGAFSALVCYGLEYVSVSLTQPIEIEFIDQPNSVQSCQYVLYINNGVAGTCTIGSGSATLHNTLFALAHQLT